MSATPTEAWDALDEADQAICVWYYQEEGRYPAYLVREVMMRAWEKIQAARRNREKPPTPKVVEVEP